MALYAQLDAIPKFYKNYREAAQDICHNLDLIANPAKSKYIQPTRVNGHLLKWNSIYFDSSARLQLRQLFKGEIFYALFHNPNDLHIRSIVDLTLLGITIGLLAAQPEYLDDSLLIKTAISYFAAKLFAVIPNFLCRESIQTQRLPPEAKNFRAESKNLIQAISLNASQPSINSNIEMVSSDSGVISRRSSTPTSQIEAGEYKSCFERTDWMRPEIKANRESKMITLNNPISYSIR